MKTSLIEHASGTRYAVIREDYLSILDNHVPSAIILDVFVQLTDILNQQDDSKNLSFLRTYDQIKKDAFVPLSKETISASLKLLESKGYIKRVSSDIDFVANKYLVECQKINDDISRAFDNEKTIVLLMKEDKVETNL